MLSSTYFTWSINEYLDPFKQAGCNYSFKKQIYLREQFFPYSLSNALNRQVHLTGLRQNYIEKRKSRVKKPS